MAKERDKVNEPFKKGIKKVAPRVDWQRMELWTEAGIPDVNFCLDGHEHWIECKWTPSVTGARFSHPLNAAQCGWILKRVDAGGSAWILARRVDEFSLWHGSRAREVLDSGYKAGHTSLVMPMVKRTWDWLELIRTLERGK